MEKYGWGPCTTLHGCSQFLPPSPLRTLNSITTMALFLAADKLATIGLPGLIRFAHQFVLFQLAQDISPVGFGGAELQLDLALHLNGRLQPFCPFAVHHEPRVAFQLIGQITPQFFVFGVLSSWLHGIRNLVLRSSGQGLDGNASLKILYR